MALGVCMYVCMYAVEYVCALVCVCMGRFLSRFWSIVDVCNEAGDTLIRQSNFVPESVRLFGLGMDSPIDILKVIVIVLVLVIVLVIVIVIVGSAVYLFAYGW